MILTGTPSRVSHSASVKPVGPAPTMSTPRFDDVLAICDLLVCGPYARDTRAKLSRSKPMNLEVNDASLLSAIARRSCAWSERWFPDAFAFAVVALAVVAIAAVGIGAPPLAVAESFGSGFWSLIPFTMQMTFI